MGRAVSSSRRSKAATTACLMFGCLLFGTAVGENTSRGTEFLFALLRPRCTTVWLNSVTASCPTSTRFHVWRSSLHTSLASVMGPCIHENHTVQPRAEGVFVYAVRQMYGKVPTKRVFEVSYLSERSSFTALYYRHGHEYCSTCCVQQMAVLQGHESQRAPCWLSRLP